MIFLDDPHLRQFVIESELAQRRRGAASLRRTRRLRRSEPLDADH